MKFLNFCISIFKRQMPPKLFSAFFLILTLAVMSVSFLLNRLDLTLTNNDALRHYQIGKIDQHDFTDVETIIIGDSSGGNAIDAEYFSRLSGTKTKNLCLTGSWGAIGSLGILQEAYRKNKHLKNIVIVQTLDVWNREYAKEAILELFPLSDASRIVSAPTLFSYYFNPKEILWNLKSLPHPSDSMYLDPRYDFLKQSSKTFSNGKKTLHSDKHYSFSLSEGKREELKALSDFCQENSLNCILMNGPLHETLVRSYPTQLISLNDSIRKNSRIRRIDTLFPIAQEQMGDEIDHVDPRYKKETTSLYFTALSDSGFFKP